MADAWTGWKAAWNASSVVSISRTRNNTAVSEKIKFRPFHALPYSGSMRGMESTRRQKQNRAIRMEAMAEQLVIRTEKQIRAEGILQAPEIVPVFAIACAKLIIGGHSSDPALGADLAGAALRIILKNLMLHGVRIPNLNMENWAPPNIHSGTPTRN